MEQIKLIIPADFRNEISETDLMIKKEEEYQTTDSSYQLNPAELMMDPTVQLILASISIIAIPSSLEGFFNFIERIKKYLYRADQSKTITIQTTEHRYTLYRLTSEDTYKEIEEYFEKLANEGKLERKL